MVPNAYSNVLNRSVHGDLYFFVALALIEALMGSVRNVKFWIVSVKDAISIKRANIHEQPYVINVLVRQQVKSKRIS
jgi:hypothetical protein